MMTERLLKVAGRDLGRDLQMLRGPKVPFGH